MLRLEDLLQHMIDAGASDLHIKAGSPPHCRVDGVLVAIGDTVLSQDDVERMALGFMPKLRVEEFMRTHEADFSHGAAGIGRFRANVFRQRGSIAMVLRRVVEVIPMLSSLGMPPAVAELAEQPSGLVIIAGPTGSGKSSTMASMVDHINRRYAKHIVTIEDPIEFIHKDLSGVVNQREIGSDTANFHEAMRRAMRQDPDVIVIGEIRDAETMTAALDAAQTGHLVLTSLHTASATETITRVVDLFPPERAHQVRAALAATLRGVVCQRLVPKIGGGRVAAIEVMVANQRIFDRIMDPKMTADIDDVVRHGNFDGMVSFDESYAELYRAGMIRADDALSHASSPHDLRITLARIDAEHSTV